MDSLGSCLDDLGNSRGCLSRNASTSLGCGCRQARAPTVCTIPSHSWGASVAVALGLKYPGLIRGLVLASGYYYPTPRPDFFSMSVPALRLSATFSTIPCRR